jgi:hypothetical protein
LIFLTISEHNRPHKAAVPLCTDVPD